MSARGAHVFSLRTKLVVFAAALVVIPGAIYGAITVSQSREAMARVVGRQFVEAARNAADQLTTMLRSEQERIHWLAAQDVMREIRIGDFDKRISSLLVSAKKSCPACVDLFVIDEQRRVVASSNPAWIGRTDGDPPGRDGARETIEGPLETASGERPILRLTVAVPDLEAPESQLGRLAALLDWERASEAISRVRKYLVSGGLDGEVLIVDARGRVIGGAGRPSGPWRPGDLLDPRLLEANDRASASYTDSAAGMLFGTARLPDTLPPWRVVVAQPLAEAFAPVYRTATLLGTALAGTLLAALAIALVAARRVTRPLAELTAAAEAVGRAGGPPPIVRLRSRDEIGTLTAAFNRMAIDLRRAERELVDAAKFAFVGELAAGVAHEVRTPLGVLRSSTQLLERSLDAKDDEARELLELLRVEVDRIERVVSGLLELGRPRELRPEPAAVGQIVFRAADFVEAQAREKHVSIRCHPIVPDPEALCDPELVYQVALNLLVNALQMLSDGGSVEVGLLPPRDGYVGFEVKDDGPGMSEEVRARIFEPYYTRRDGGAGLGLTFVRRVVQEHHGHISVESTPGSGAVFRVELPRARGLGMKRLLVVDDDARMRRVLQILAHKIGLDCAAVSGADEALASFHAERSDVVVTDLKMPGKSGIEFLRELRAIDGEVPVVVLTAHGTVATAVEAMKLGAVDYLQKPFDVDALELVIRRALDLFRFRLENRFLREQAGGHPRSGELIGCSPAMLLIFDLLREVAPTRSAVLVTGETGTGKELVARAIHELSPRKDKLFVPLNCTAIPSELLESELFGHARGAFSGAQTDRVGKFQAADDGTLFLDEIGDMDVRLQAKLLRVLQEKVVEPLGTNRRIPIDVRIVSSTNRDLETAMREGKFREDLYFRLNVFHVKLPPLRERKEDIAELAEAFLAGFARDLGKPGLRLAPEAVPLLEGYAWPGNIRELRNLTERAAVLCRGSIVGPSFVRSLLPADVEPRATDLDLDRALGDLERRMILDALAATGDDKLAAAKLLGIGERTLWTKLKKHAI